MNTKPISASQSVKETNNMKKLKTFLCSALAIVSLLSLTACGDAKAPEKQPGSDPTSEPTVAIQDTTEATIPEGMTEIDAFADFEIKYEEVSPYVMVKITHSIQIEDATVDFFIEDSKNHYKNDDVITIKAVIGYGKDKYVLKEATKDFTVHVDSYLISSVEEITNENMTAMRNKADAVMNEYIDYWENADNYIVSGYELIDCEFVMINDGWTSSKPNRLIFYYKVNATDNAGNDKSSYFYVYLYNIIQHDDGTQTVDINEYKFDGACDHGITEDNFKSLQEQIINGNYEAYTITKVELN